MISINTNRRPLRRAALVLALGACISSGAAFAQSRSAGTIAGEAQPGSQVTITSETGLTRTVDVGADGSFRLPELPVGQYDVSVLRNGAVVSSRENIYVDAGSTRNLNFSAMTTELTAVTVTAQALPAIDVGSVDTKTVLTSQILTQVPVARDITQAAILAPSVIPADSRYGNSVSFGGAAASENAYFINGYPVKNILTNIGSTTLPFHAIRTEQVITGGYSARYGRSTGGVINITTQSGSNEWQAGALVTYVPESLRGTRKDIYYEDDTGAALAGTLYQRNSGDESNPLTYGAYASGPLLKDRLFFYATGEWESDTHKFNNQVNDDAATGAYKDEIEDVRWMAKIDWNITNNHILEFTAISDKHGNDRSRYSYDYETGERGDVVTGGYRYKDTAETYIVKYTGYLTDTLTLSALYGKQDVTNFSVPFQYNPNALAIIDDRPGVSDPITGLQPYVNVDDPEAYNKSEGGRIDLQWVLGDHSLSLGYDVLDTEVRAGTIMSGPGYAWFYYHTDNGDIPNSGGLTTTPNSDYVDKYIYENGGTFKVEQKAYYIEDRWQLNDRWLLSLGLRNDSFTNYNSDGIEYISQSNQWAPRLGASWDVNGDGSMKVFANVGRYFLALPPNVAVRGAAGSTYTETYYTFTGVDPVTGAPTGLELIGGPYSANNEFGQAPDPRTVAAKDIESHYQDEAIIGFEQMLGSDWAWGVKGQYRVLQSAIDDICDNRPAIKYAEENNLELTGEIPVDCRLFNPGADNVLLLDLPDGIEGNLLEVPYNQEDYGMDLERKYAGVSVFLEHPFDGKWFGKVTYTWSHNWGNAEGQLDSDIGQGDVSQTVLFDHRELMAYGTGDLPNDRRHVLKAYGFYEFTPEWRVGSSLFARTGRPRNCFGYIPPDSEVYSEFWDTYLNYGRYYHFCGGEPVPRGSVGRLPTDWQVSVNAAYTPAWADGNLKFQVDVYNIFDKQVVQNREERGYQGGLGVVDVDRYRVLTYGAPRSIRFTARYDFDFDF